MKARLFTGGPSAGINAAQLDAMTGKKPQKPRRKRRRKDPAKQKPHGQTLTKRNGDTFVLHKWEGKTKHVGLGFKRPARFTSSSADERHAKDNAKIDAAFRRAISIHRYKVACPDLVALFGMTDDDIARELGL